MSATGYTPILIYGSTTTGNTPSASNLTTTTNGVELAINATDGKLFYKDNNGVVQVLATKGASQNSISFGTTGLTPNTATQGAVTVAGTLITSNGGTGLSSYTAGDLPYYASGTALSKLGIGTNGQILTSSGTAPQWSTLSGVAVTTFQTSLSGLTPSSATSGAITLAGTLGVSSGGTGLTSLTSGYIPYGNGTSAFSSSSAFSFDGSNLTLSTSQNSATKVNVTNSNSGTSAVARYEASNGSNTAEFGIRGTSQSTNGILAPQVGYAYSPSAAGLGLVAAAGPILFASNGTSEVARFSTAGYLGIGTSSPITKLHINSPDANTDILFTFGNNNGGGQLGVDNNGYPIVSSYGVAPIRFGNNSGSSFAETMRLDSSGNLGLGVTPSGWYSQYKAMQFSGGLVLASFSSGGAYVGSNYYSNSSGVNTYISSSYATSYGQSTTGQHQWFTAPSGSAGGIATFTQAMTLDNSGNLLLNTTSTNNGAKFSVTADASSAQVLGLRDSASTYANNDNYILFSNSAGNPAGGITHPASTSLGVWGNTDLRFMYGSGATEGMRLDTSGNLLVGTTTTLNVATSGNYISGGTASYIGTGHASGTASGSSYTAYYYNATYIGGITQNGTTGVLYNTTSDQRLKTNIVDAPSGNIDQIKVRSFDFKSDNSHVEYGFIAQELVEVAPYAVHQPTNPDEMMGVDYSKLVPMMIREIQDLKAEVNQLKQKIGV